MFLKGNLTKSKKQFLVIGNQYVLYILDNRDGHIKYAERNVLILDVSYIDLLQLPKLSEEELFELAEDTTTLISAEEIY